MYIYITFLIIYWAIKWILVVNAYEIILGGIMVGTSVYMYKIRY